MPQVVGQIDEKFIAIVMAMNPEETAASADRETKSQELVVLVDQHAAHERVRLEQLTASV